MAGPLGLGVWGTVQGVGGGEEEGVRRKEGRKEGRREGRKEGRKE